MTDKDGISPNLISQLLTCAIMFIGIFPQIYVFINRRRLDKDEVLSGLPASVEKNSKGYTLIVDRHNYEKIQTIIENPKTYTHLDQISQKDVIGTLLNEAKYQNEKYGKNITKIKIEGFPYASNALTEKLNSKDCAEEKTANNCSMFS